MLPAMKRPSIAIVGAGRLGTALAMRLAEAGYSIPEVIARGNPQSLRTARTVARKVGARVVTLRTTQLTADLIWFCVPDAEISNAATELSRHDWRGKIAFHSSGVLTSEIFRVLYKEGAQAASVHPLMTFVAGSLPELIDVPFALEGDAPAVAMAKTIMRKLGGNPFAIRKQDKPAYHAFATMICPLLVSLLASSEAVAELAGIPNRETRRRMMPIIRQTLANYAQLGPADAFSGPIVRGDAATIRLHLRSLAKAPAARDAYLALARAALEYLPSQKKRELRSYCKGPSSA
jgi:predicted short-subunit dehydrogenase-like oxidoreductase (DUF2520 family)